MEAKTTCSDSKILQELIIAFNLVNSNPKQFCFNSSLKILRVEKNTSRATNLEIINSIKDRLIKYSNELSTDTAFDSLHSLKEKVLQYCKSCPDKSLKTYEKKVEESFQIIIQENPILKTKQLLSKKSCEISQEEVSSILFPFLNSIAKEKASANMLFLMIVADTFVQFSLEQFQEAVTPLVVESTHENKQSTLFCPKYISSLIPPQTAEEASIAFALEKATKQNSGLALDKIAEFSKESSSLSQRSQIILKAWQCRQITMLSGKFYDYIKEAIRSIVTANKDLRISELSDFFSHYNEFLAERMNIARMMSANRMPYIHDFYELMFDSYDKYVQADSKYNEIYRLCYDKLKEVLSHHPEYSVMHAHPLLEKTLPSPEEFSNLTVLRKPAKEIINFAFCKFLDDMTLFCTEPETVLYDAMRSCLDIPENMRIKSQFAKYCCNQDAKRNEPIKHLFYTTRPQKQKSKEKSLTSLTANDLNEFLPKSAQHFKKTGSGMQPQKKKTHHKRGHRNDEQKSIQAPIEILTKQVEKLSLEKEPELQLPKKVPPVVEESHSDTFLARLGIKQKFIALHGRVERWFTNQDPTNWDKGYAQLTKEEVFFEKICHSFPGYVSQVILRYGLKSHWHSKTSSKDGIRFSIPGEISICDSERNPIKTYPGVYSDCYDKKRYESNNECFLYHHYFVAQSFDTTLKELQNKGRYISLQTIDDGVEPSKEESNEPIFLDDDGQYILEHHTPLCVSIYDIQANIRYTACLV